MPDPRTRLTPARMAKLIFVLYFLESAASLFGQLFVMGQLVVRSDAAASATNILANETLFRAGIAASLVSVAFHVATAVLVYYFLRPVSPTVSLLAALLLVVGCGVQAFVALLQAGALIVLLGARSLSAFSAGEVQAIALILLNWNAQAYNYYLVFFGLWCVAVGYLIFRSTFLPRILGIGMALAGVGYSVYLYPPLGSYIYPYNLVLGIGEAALLLWLLIFGVNERRWHEQARAVGVAPALAL